MVKLLVWTRGGFTIVHKRLERGTFARVFAEDEARSHVELDVHELSMQGELSFHELGKASAEQLVEVARWTYESRSGVGALVSGLSLGLVGLIEHPPQQPRPRVPRASFGHDLNGDARLSLGIEHQTQLSGLGFLAGARNALCASLGPSRCCREHPVGCASAGRRSTEAPRSPAGPRSAAARSRRLAAC